MIGVDYSQHQYCSEHPEEDELRGVEVEKDPLGRGWPSAAIVAQRRDAENHSQGDAPYHQYRDEIEYERLHGERIQHWGHTDAVTDENSGRAQEGNEPGAEDAAARAVGD